MNLIERVLCKLFQHVDITDDDGTQVYLRRWFVYPHNPKDNKLQGRLYLHKFCKSDNLRDLHDHPWPYRTLILWRGYWEHSFNPDWRKWLGFHRLQQHDGHRLDEIRQIPRRLNDKERAEVSAIFLRDLERSAPEPEKTIRKWYGPLSSFKRGAKWTHAVELKGDKPSWTLFFTGPKERSWGFHTEKGWCWHRNYRGGVCWCYDLPSALDSARLESPADEVANVSKGTA